MYLTPSHKKLGAVEKRQRLVSRETWPNAARPASPSGQRWKQGKCSSGSTKLLSHPRTLQYMSIPKEERPRTEERSPKDQGPRTKDQGRSSHFDPLLSSQLRIRSPAHFRRILISHSLRTPPFAVVSVAERSRLHNGKQAHS